MIARLTALFAAYKPLVIVGAMLLTAAGGTGLWVKVLYDRIDTLQTKVERMECEAGQMDIALQNTALDNQRLSLALERQSAVVEAMREEMLGERERADAAVEALANQPTPPAAEGDGAMLDWWNDHVVR